MTHLTLRLAFRHWRSRCQSPLAWRWQLFTMASLANHLLARFFLGSPKRWNSLVAALRLGDFGPPPQQTWCCLRPVIIVCLVPWRSTGWQVICADVDTKQVVTSKLQTFDIGFFYCGIEHALVPRWDKSLNVSGDYVEVWWVSSATHVSCIQVAAYRVSTLRSLLMSLCTYIAVAKNCTLTSRTLRIFLNAKPTVLAYSSCVSVLSCICFSLFSITRIRWHLYIYSK